MCAQSINTYDLNIINIDRKVVQKSFPRTKI